MWVYDREEFGKEIFSLPEKRWTDREWREIKAVFKVEYLGLCSLHHKVYSHCVLKVRLTSDLSSDCHPSIRTSAARLLALSATNQHFLLIYWLLSAHGSQPVQTRCAPAARLHRFFSSHLKLREQNRPGLELDQAGAQFAKRDHQLSPPLLPPIPASLCLLFTLCPHFFLFSFTEFECWIECLNMGLNSFYLISNSFSKVL